jgi:translocation and assembly module TamB
MATAARMERHEHHHDRKHHQQFQPERGRRWPWILGFFLVGFVVLVWMLPVIITSTPLMDWIVQKAAGNYKGSISMRSVSLGWFSPIVVNGLEIRDEQNKPMVEAVAISSEKSLLDILCNYTQLGQFRVEKPTLSLVLRSDGSNLEDLAASFPSQSTEKKSSTKFAVDLAVADGTIKIADRPAKQSWEVDKINVNFSMPSDDSQPMAVKASAELADPRQPGKLAAELKIGPSQGVNSKDSGDVTVQAVNVSLAMAQSILGRFLPQTRLEGVLNCSVHAIWGGEGSEDKMTVQADAGIDQFVFASSMLGTDCVQLARIHAAGQATRSADNIINIAKAAVECDLADLTLAGDINLGGQGKGSSPNSLLRQKYDLSGHVDLARLAAMFPNTLHIRKETKITSGQIQLAFSSQKQANADNQNGVTWHGQIEAGNLVATDNGRQFAWVKPIAVTLDAHDTAQGPVIDNLKCDSDFLKIHAAGTPDALAVSLSYNLKQLADQLGQFVDMGKIQLAGDGFGNVNWKRDAQQQFNADAELQLHNLQVILPDKQPWQEENFLVYCSAKGKTDGTANSRLDEASINLKAGDDRLSVQLLQSIADWKDGGVWPVRMMMQGQLQSWNARLASFLPLNNWRMSGTIDLDVQATGSKDGVNIGQAKVSLNQFVMTSPYLNMDEPKIELLATGSWDQRQRRLKIAPATLTGSSLAIQADNLVMAMPQNGSLELGGTIKYQGDLGRVRQWFADRAKPPTWDLAGQAIGSVQFKQSAELVQYETAAEISNLAVTDSTGGQFQEPLVRLSARGDYATKAGLVRLEQAQIASSFVAANAAGRVDLAQDQTQANVDSQLSYDLDRLCGLMRPYLGQNVRFAGRGSSPATWRGPLSLDAGQASAALKWDTADLYGFQIGPGEIKPSLANGVLQIEPAEMSVNQGKMYLAPKVRLAPQPMELTMPAGPLLKQVEIDPHMCSLLLKYIAPVLADVTTAQGAFSIDLEGCRIPLSDPAKGDLAGKFIIHSIEIGPGPLIRELAVLMGRETPAKLRREGVVPFRMVDGRVYHQNMELIFPDFTIQTYGSVGLDQTVAIMTEMPVPPKWLENNPAAAALRNQTIRLPIAGTLQKPQIDRAAMQQASAQFIRSAAKNMLEEGLNKGLDRLFQQQK